MARYIDATKAVERIKFNRISEIVHYRILIFSPVPRYVIRSF